MNDVPIRQLNQDTAGVLARVKAGERLAVTERARVVAYLTPAAPPELAALVASGRVRAPTLSGLPPRPRGAVQHDDEAGALLSEQREDRF